MNRLFFKISVIVWLISVVSLFVVLGFNYLLGVFPPLDEQAKGRSDFGLAVLADVLENRGPDRAMEFARFAASADPPLHVALAREDGGPRCPTSVDDPRKRFVLRDGICWRLESVDRRPSWLTVSIAKTMPLFATILTSLVASLWIVRYFMGPLRRLRDGLAGLAGGDFSRRLEPDPRERDELAMLARDFDQTAARLQAFQEGQQRLFHDVSHELRSPLSRLQAAMGMLRITPGRLDEMLLRMEAEIGRLDGLVEEILTLARLNAPGWSEPQRQRLDVIDLVSEIIEDACFEGQAKGVRVTYRGVDSFVAEVNGELVYRAIENVVRNAVKFSARQTEVLVTGEVGDGRLRLTFFDTGPGVPEEELETIFRAFARASVSASVPGHGLGLAIARQAVWRHGGTLTASMRPTGGLAVLMTLPASSVSARSAAPDPAAERRESPDLDRRG